MALSGHVFPNPPPSEYAWVQVVSVSDESCEIDIPTDEGIELLGDARNQYILWHHRDIILNASPNPSQPNQALQDSNAAVVENTEQPTMGVEQGGNNENDMPRLSPVQETLDEGALAESVDDEDNFLRSSPSPATKRPAIPHTITSH